MGDEEVPFDFYALEGDHDHERVEEVCDPPNLLESKQGKKPKKTKKTI